MKARWWLAPLLVGVLLRLFTFVVKDNSDFDSMNRVFLAIDLDQRTNLVWHVGAWLSAHLYLINFFHHLGIDPVMGGRILSLFFGLLSLPVILWVYRQLFDQQIAFWAGMLAALYFTHIEISVWSLADAPASFFLWLSVGIACVLFRSQPVQSRLSLLWFALIFATNAACLFRQEMWVYTALLYAALFWKLRDPRALLFAFAGYVVPLAYLVYSWQTFGNPLRLFQLYEVAEKSKFVEWGSDSVKQILKVLARPLQTPSLAVLVLIPVGLLAGWRQNYHRGLILLIFLYFAYLLYQAVFKQMDVYLRYMVNTFLLCFPYVILGAIALIQKSREAAAPLNRRGVTALSFITVFTLIAQAGLMYQRNQSAGRTPDIYSLLPAEHLRTPDKRLIERMQQEMAPGEPLHVLGGIGHGMYAVYLLRDFAPVNGADATAEQTQAAERWLQEPNNDKTRHLLYCPLGFSAEKLRPFLKTAGEEGRWQERARGVFFVWYVSVSPP
ncbi:MAG: hypothetical protein KIT45_06320 [Fimbriimonadia bacterium]|nr:hypothetical protein [Fimbriimonadia bacterium]